jgi:uncharacterized protein (DUF1778 family)
MENRTEEIVLRLTLKEKEYIEKSAKKVHLDIEQFILLLVLSNNTPDKYIGDKIY